MKTVWSCTEPMKIDDVIKYTIYNNINETRIKCTAQCEIKEAKEKIKITLNRMNNGKGNYQNGLR